MTEEAMEGGLLASGESVRGATTTEQRSSSHDGTELVSINFAAPWRLAPFIASISGAIKGCRVVGLAECRLDAHHDPARSLRPGLLLRHVRSMKYRLAGDFGVLELDADRTDTFLQRIRQGHHGGPGRCQGPLTVDGYSYPSKISISVPTETIRWTTRFGRGAFSVGLRRLASVAAERMMDEDGSLVVPPVSRKRPPKTGPGSLKRSSVYLDAESVQRFRTVGAGNLSRGIRFAHQFVAQKAK